MLDYDSDFFVSHLAREGVAILRATPPTTSEQVTPKRVRSYLRRPPRSATHPFRNAAPGSAMGRSGTQPHVLGKGANRPLGGEL